MKQTHRGRCIRAARTIAAPAADVWRAWAEPERIAQWFVDGAEGTCRPGEVMTWIFDAFGYRLPVPILEAEPGRRLVTGSTYEAMPALLEVDIETTDGATTLRLVNSGFSEAPDKDDEVEGVRSGWEMALGQLAFWLERRPAGQRAHRIVMRPTAASPARIRELYASAAGRARWAAELELGDEVLVDTGGELLLAWPRIGGVVGLKTFRLGPQRMLALDASAWRAADDLPGLLQRALDRLGALADSTEG